MTYQQGRNDRIHGGEPGAEGNEERRGHDHLQDQRQEARQSEGRDSKYNYFKCVAFRDTAEYVYKYLNSNSRVAVSGSVENYNYVGRDGMKRYGTQIIVDEAEIISTTVNAGDAPQNQQPNVEQYDGFKEVEDVELPFL